MHDASIDRSGVVKAGIGALKLLDDHALRDAVHVGGRVRICDRNDVVVVQSGQNAIGCPLELRPAFPVALAGRHERFRVLAEQFP